MYKLIIIIFFYVFNLTAQNKIDSVFLNDLYFQKLVKTNSKIPLFYNEQVRKNILDLIKNSNNSTVNMIEKVQMMSKQYNHYFEKLGVPKQLFLAIYCNSLSNPSYLAPDGASGMWAFNHAVAQKYNLVTNSYVDERRNPEKSTQAAALYFNDLNVIYKDWLKTLVAFRIGPINMNLALRRAGNSMDYSKIHNKLNLEQQKIAENYMAFWYIWNYYKDHRIVISYPDFIETDTVHVKKEISFSAIASVLDISQETLIEINPELKLKIVPVFYNKKGFKIPIDKKELYHQNLNVLFPSDYVFVQDTLIVDSLGLDSFVVIKKPIIPIPIENKVESNKNTKVVFYKVKKGDGLILLADVFDCQIAEIKKWNKLKSNKIVVGQKLKIEVPASKYAKYNKINKMTMAEKKKLAKKS